MCYPVKTLLPLCEQIIIDEKSIHSRLLQKNERDLVKHIVNMFLEIFGECELVNENTESIYSSVIERLPWHILPKGENPWECEEQCIRKIYSKLTKTKKHVLYNRSKFFRENKPSLVAVGQDSFKGYIVYGYESINLYFFESFEEGNATYVFRGEWKNASKLTKKDVISQHLCYQRLIHNSSWEEKVRKLMNS